MLEAYKTIRQLHEALYKECRKVRAELVGKKDLTNVADTCLLLRKSMELMEDSRKEMKRLSEHIASTASLVMVATGEPVPNGKYARAHLKTSFSATVPSYRTEPEKYEDVCNAIGVTANEFTRLHYPTIRKFMTERMEKGEQLPPALEKCKQHSEALLVAVQFNDPDADLAKTDSLI